MIPARVRDIGELVKFSHSIFALPFALGSMWLAAGGWPGWRTCLLICAAMVTARTCAMACNRWADRDIDRHNPRTQSRPSIDGRVSARSMLWLMWGSGLAFVVSCALLNRMALLLSPLALLAVCGYSFTKRFTNWPHLFVGLALGLAPVAAEVAVLGSISLPFVLLGCAVLCWVAGFDMIYALLDIDFDRAHGIHSLPARYGIARTLWIARATHLFAAVGFVSFGALLDLSPIYTLCAGLMCIALGVEHWLVRPNDLSKVNAAFFTANGWVSMLFLCGALLG